MKKVPIGSKPQSKPSAPSADAWVDQANRPNQAVEKLEPLKRLTIEVPLTLHHAIKRKCVDNGVTMADVIRDLIAGYVAAK